MIVLVYFFEKMGVLRKPINDKKSSEEVSRLCCCLFSVQVLFHCNVLGPG